MKQIARYCIAAFLILLTTGNLHAQEVTPPVLPDFSAKIKTGKIQLDWISGFRNVSQIGVQRSLDSVINFYTIGYAVSPNEIRNAYMDNKPLPGKNYYRLFIQFNNGKYMYSKVMEAIPDSTINESAKLTAQEIREIGKLDPNNPPPVKTTSSEPPRKAQDPPEKPKEPERIPWKPSNCIYTTADGNVNIRLPEAPKKNYKIKFFESTGEFLFEIPQVQEPFLIIEKAIFMHAGWFNFEIIEGDKLKEKWNFYIPLNYRS
ncbi:hypothetical protein LX64_03588 [Chitinophaga skermanii]|uniref:Uncharacterized protein n=1 Tax=Chitinophaga skermanii TaxID=331697 RepID=A0A327QFA5_9BACT|nr:hypothetical protein [Chitinophaga skermanii]RAJ02568.1 hypothetical protein LX64_03588 [Chitinophaga skermanii]